MTMPFQYQPITAYPTRKTEPLQLLRQQQDQQNRERQYGNTANDAYINRARGFNAQQGLNTYAQGAYNTISKQLQDELRRVGGQAVGAGRLDTGFYDTDQGRVINNATQQLTNSIAQQALGAQGQQLENDQGLADFGRSYTQDANDLMTARQQTLNDEMAARRKKRSGIGGAIGSALGAGAGFLLGGPAGAQAGYQLGGGIGGAIG